MPLCYTCAFWAQNLVPARSGTHYRFTRRWIIRIGRSRPVSTNIGHCRGPWASGGGVEQQGRLITCDTRSRDPNQAHHVGDDGGH
jgi:hypothetical protein